MIHAVQQESPKNMALSRVQRLQPPAHCLIQLMIAGLVFFYLAILFFLFIIKTHEFKPFENVKDDFFKINPFEDNLVKAPDNFIRGKGIVIKLNSMCNFILDSSPDFNYLVYSKNMLGHLCAATPEEVSFVAYIRYEKNLLRPAKNQHPALYQLSKKVAVLSWPAREVVAYRVFTQTYPLPPGLDSLSGELERRLCLITSAPGDEEVKQWLTSLAQEENYFYN